MIAYWLLVAHLFGDYVLQSDWMARTKTRRTAEGRYACSVHAMTYTLPFLFLTRNIYALLIICLTHAVIDHLGLARYVCYAKNYLSPMPKEIKGHNGELLGLSTWWYPWKECRGTGYRDPLPGQPQLHPPWLTTWLFIICDNAFHLLCNGLALVLFP